VGYHHQSVGRRGLPSACLRSAAAACTLEDLWRLDRCASRQLLDDQQPPQEDFHRLGWLPLAKIGLLTSGGVPNERKLLGVFSDSVLRSRARLNRASTAFRVPWTD